MSRRLAILAWVFFVLVVVKSIFAQSPQIYYIDFAAGSNTNISFNSGTTGTCTVTITPGITANTGFACTAKDLTTPADEPKQTAYTTTTATLSWTTVSGDLITWNCAAF